MKIDMNRGRWVVRNCLKLTLKAKSAVKTNDNTDIKLSGIWLVTITVKVKFSCFTKPWTLSGIFFEEKSSTNFHSIKFNTIYGNMVISLYLIYLYTYTVCVHDSSRA